MALTSLQMRDVCYGAFSNNGNDTCKYLDSVTRDDGKYVSICTKKSPKAFAGLEKKRKSQTWHVPIGDNCPGYTYLLHKMQGYDV